MKVKVKQNLMIGQHIVAAGIVETDNMASDLAAEVLAELEAASGLVEEVIEAGDEAPVVASAKKKRAV